MKKKIFWIATASILIWVAIGQYWPVTVHIRGTIPEEDFSIRMPSKDKKRLEFFFREVLFLNTWAYTLMGSKPISSEQYIKPWAVFLKSIKHPDFIDIMIECFIPPNFKKTRSYFTPEQLRMKLGWKTLNKYVSRFPNSRFFLYTSFSKDNETVLLAIIDKIKLIRTVKLYLNDFQAVLKSQAITPEDLIDNIKLRQFMKGLTHVGFEGTLLGFGRDNAWLYDKCRDENPAEWPMTSAWPEEEIVNLEELNRKTFAYEPWELSDLFYPRFACDPNSEETKQLKQTYRKEREIIVKYYEGKDIVEATLSLFNQKLRCYTGAFPFSG